MKESEIIEKIKEGYKQEFNEIPDNSNFLDELKKANRKKKKPFILLWLSKPIPAYSLALTSLLFMIMFFIVKPKTTELLVYRDVETIIQYDTIVLRDTVEIENKIERLKNKPAQILVRNTPKQSTKNSSTPIKTVINKGEFYFDVSQVSEQQNLSGSSSADSELAQFLGVNI